MSSEAMQIYKAIKGVIYNAKRVRIEKASIVDNNKISKLFDCDPKNITFALLLHCCASALKKYTNYQITKEVKKQHLSHINTIIK